MKILLVNQCWFQDELRAAGHTVRSCGYQSFVETEVPSNVLHIHTILKEHLDGYEPDVLIWFDNSSPILISGIEELTFPTIFYSVDSHHHASLHRFVSHMFDHTLVAQKNNIAEFNEVGSNPEWMPLWASKYVEPSDEKEYGAVFIGTLNKKLNPERVAFFEALEKEVPILVTQGHFPDFFPKAEIVVNQTVKGDLNFRVFESMLCGPLLLTERSENGLFEIFEDSVHLVTYEKNNVEEAATKIRYYLDHPAEARKIAEQGRAEVMAKHTPKHRAGRLLELIEGLEKTPSPIKNFAASYVYGSTARTVANISSVAYTKAIVASLASAEYGLKYKEPLTDELMGEILHPLLAFKNIFSSAAAQFFMHSLLAAYPKNILLNLVRIHELVEAGETDQAIKHAVDIFGDDPENVLKHAKALTEISLETYNPGK